MSAPGGPVGGAGGLTWDDLLDHALDLPGAWRDEPWEGDTVVKVGDKIFAFLGAPPADGERAGVGVKCGTRAEADEWVDEFPDDATPSAYIGRYGWNRLLVGGAIPDDQVLEAVTSSYEQVVARLPRSKRPLG